MSLASYLFLYTIVWAFLIKCVHAFVWSIWANACGYELHWIISFLLQRYDPDPAAKAAAATVLASKLGSDSGLKVYVGDESHLNVPIGKSNDVEVVQSSGMQNRKQLQTRSSNPGSPALHHSDEIPHNACWDVICFEYIWLCGMLGTRCTRFPTKWPPQDSNSRP